jgi:hypothetical protein
MSLLVLHLTGVESALKTNSSDVTRLSKGAEEFNKVAANAPKELMLSLEVKGRGPCLLMRTPLCCLVSQML